MVVLKPEEKMMENVSSFSHDKSTRPPKLLKTSPTQTLIDQVLKFLYIYFKKHL